MSRLATLMLLPVTLAADTSVTFKIRDKEQHIAFLPGAAPARGSVLFLPGDG